MGRLTRGMTVCLALAWGFAACSESPDLSASQQPTDTSGASSDAGVGSDDTGGSDTGAPVFDAGADTSTATECPGGTGCPCKENDDCDGSLCLEGPGGTRCAGACTTSCPAGFLCKLVPNGADVTSACISAWARLCDPCSSNADCRYLGIDTARCVNRGEAGGFCGTACTPQDDDCPTGYACKSVKDLDGQTSKQCVPFLSDGQGSGKLAACVCSANAVARAAKTTCYQTLIVKDVELSCPGKAQCSSVGKAPTCLAKEPAEELCDGLDNDCDGATDEAGCDDNNPCTVDTCDPSEGCVHAGVADGTGCEADDSVCTQGDVCKGGKCMPGTAISCDDKNPCTLSTCDPKVGCVQKNFDGTSCEDGNPCTVGDSCVGGACVAGKPKQCNAIQSCGKGVCDASKGGVCSFGSKPDGSLCDDGNACSTNDACTSGQCAGKKVICDDKNPCTSDSCAPLQGCQYTANTASCDDGDACTVGDTCQAKACVAGKAKGCDDGNPCTTDSCAKGVCAHAAVADKTPCKGAAGGASSGAAWCLAGTCQGKAAGTSCAAVRAADPKAKSGLYSIDPDGAGPVAPVKLFCDMDQGGWTLVGNFYDTKADDMPNSTALLVSGWRRTATGVWAKGAQQVDRKGDAASNAAVGLDFVAALKASASQQHLKICLVHQNGSDAVCRSTFAGTLTAAAYTGGNPKLAPYKADALTYTFGRLAGLAGSADGYTSFQTGKFGFQRAPGRAGEFGFSKEGLVEKAEDGDCLGDGGPWHGSGCGVSYRPHRTGFDELSVASCCLVGGGHPLPTGYGFRLYVGPAPKLGSLNQPATSCQAIVDAKASLGDGLYWLDLTGQGTKATQVSCQMSADGGGWTQLTDAVAKTLKPGVQRFYLLSKEGRWYRSPNTSALWSWSAGQQLAGTWHYFNGTAQSSFSCLGSAEKPTVGLGCSAGKAQKAKVLPTKEAKPAAATVTVCQDFPNAFGGVACEPDVQVWVR